MAHGGNVSSRSAESFEQVQNQGGLWNYKFTKIYPSPLYPSVIKENEK